MAAPESGPTLDLTEPRRIHVVGVGAPGEWNDVFLAGSAEHVDLLSGHFYAERKMRLLFSAEDARKYQDQFENYSVCVLNGVREIVAAMDPMGHVSGLEKRHPWLRPRRVSSLLKKSHVGVAVVLPPPEIAAKTGVAVQLPPQQSPLDDFFNGLLGF